MKRQKLLHLSKKFVQKYINDRNYRTFMKVMDHCHYAGKYGGVAHGIYNLKYSISKEIPMNTHNKLNYYYHFIKKELEKKFEG